MKKIIAFILLIFITSCSLNSEKELSDKNTKNNSNNIIENQEESKGEIKASSSLEEYLKANNISWEQLNKIKKEFNNDVDNIIEEYKKEKEQLVTKEKLKEINSLIEDDTENFISKKKKNN